MVKSEPKEKKETSNMADFNFEEYSDVFEDTQEPIDFEALSDIFEDTGVPTEEMAKESAMKARETSTATRSLTEEERAAKFPPVVQETIATQDVKGSEVGVMSAPVVQETIATQDVLSDTSFLTFIAKGEGDYGSSNRGTKNNRIQGSTNSTVRGGSKLTELTIEEIRKYQKIKDPDNADRLFAVGKYQLIPTTFDMAVNALGLPKNTVFSKEVQEEMGRYLLFSKRPALGSYIKGESNDEAKALLEAAKEWASLPDPKTGNSYYGKGNKAQHSLKETKIALTKARNEYAKLKRTKP
jgi:muramidase (phage lysozyme)